jgi:hypothetical protein
VSAGVRGDAAAHPAVRVGMSYLLICEACGSWTYFPRSTPSLAARGTSGAASGFSTSAAPRAPSSKLPPEWSPSESTCRHGLSMWRANRESRRTRHPSSWPQAAGSFLRAVRSRLRPRGVLYVETPNDGSFTYRVGRILSVVMRRARTGLLERLFPPQHAHYFTPESLKDLARRCGFEIAAAGTRALAAADLSVSPAAVVPIQALQFLDRLSGREVLIWPVLRKDGSLA